MTITPLLREVGRGKRGARDLTREEAAAAAEHIFQMSATPAQIGAFLMAERIKTESADELEAFTAVCRRYAHRSDKHLKGIDFAGPYDGRIESFYASFASAFVLAAAGVPVTMHGSASLPPKRGITVLDLAAARGIRLDALPPSGLREAAAASGVLIVPTEQWCAPLKELRSIREQLGMRTILNSVEKLLDFSHSPHLVFGVYHGTQFVKLEAALPRLGYKRSIIVQGAEGSEDLHIHRPTRVSIVEAGGIESFSIDPDQYGLLGEQPQLQWTPELQVKAAEAVLQGHGDVSLTNQVILNCAVRLLLTEQSGSVEEGVVRCKALLASGEAWSAYKRWLRILSAAAAAS